jgi:hypothetical protein
MGKEANICGISSNPPQMLDDDRGPRTDCFAQLYASVKPVHSAAQEIAGRDVCLASWPHIVSSEFNVESRSLNDRQRLPRLEAEPRVKAKRAVMVRLLDESVPGISVAAK